MVTANKKQIYIVTPTSITESSDVRSEDTLLKYLFPSILNISPPPDSSYHDRREISYTQLSLERDSAL